MKTKSFTLVQLFSIVDGRLSTSMDDVYDILNHITGDNLMTHHLPVAMKFVSEILKPSWFYDARKDIDAAIAQIGTSEFKPLIDHLERNNKDYLVTCAKDDTEPHHFEKFFHDYMMENSLLKGN